MSVSTILKSEVGDMLLALNYGNRDRGVEYHLALATIAMMLGQKSVVDKMRLPDSVRDSVQDYESASARTSLVQDWTL